MIKLSNQQEKFVQEIVKGKSQYDAYQIAYPTSTKWERNSVDSKASQLMSDAKIMQRLEELRKPIIAKCQKTAEDLIRELDEIKGAAFNDLQYTPAISAVMGQARLLGLDKEVKEHQGSITIEVVKFED